jgi:hypothetical protein
MSIVFRCTCGAKLQTASDKAGKKIVCPKCSSLTTVPIVMRLGAEPNQNEIHSGQTSPTANRQQVKSDFTAKNNDAPNTKGSANEAADVYDPFAGSESTAPHHGIAQTPANMQQPMSGFVHSNQPGTSLNFGGQPAANSLPLPPPVNPVFSKPFAKFVIAAGVIGCLFGLIQLAFGIIGVANSFTALVGLSDLPGRDSSPASSMIETAIWLTILKMIAMMFFGVAAMVGGAGLLFQKKWPWFVSVACAGIAGLMCLMAVLSLVSNSAAIVQQPRANSSIVQRNFYQTSSRRIHQRAMLYSVGAIVWYGSFSGVSFWLLLVPKVRKYYFNFQLRV